MVCKGAEATVDGGNDGLWMGKVKRQKQSAKSFRSCDREVNESRYLLWE